VLYRLHVPSPPLDHFVERLWFVSGGEAARQDCIVPSGTVELVVNLRDDRVRIDRTARCSHVQEFAGAAVSGPYAAAFMVAAEQHAAMMGVHFRPGGAPAVLGVPAHLLADRHVDLADLWGRRAAASLRDRLCAAATVSARFRILEQALAARVSTRRGPHPAVALALAAFAGEARPLVGALARRAGLSRRRFSSVFVEAVGLAPKPFGRIVRVQRAHAVAARGGRIDWSALALDCGFYDQAHLANEFRRLTGFTPTRYERALVDRHRLLRGHVAAR
jgi:AraC-like DNA-binding protein